MARGGRRERRPLGAPFGWLLSAGGSSNLVDGLMLAAGPLLVAHLTTDPFFVALAVVVQQVPWIVLGLVAGVVADRRSRVAILAVGSLVRLVAFVLVAITVLTGTMSLPVLYAALLLMGSAETFIDNAWQSLVPDTVPSADLGTANARASGVTTLMNQLIGPAIGGVLFTIGAAVPYASAAVLSAAAIVLVLRVRVPPRDVAPAPAEPIAGEPAAPITRPTPVVVAEQVAEPAADAAVDPAGVPVDAGTRSEPSRARGARGRELAAGVLADIAAGARWLWANGPVRVLALVICLFNVTFGMTWSMLVLWSTERLGLGPEGYGALLAVSAVGGLVAALLFPWIDRRAPYGLVIRVALGLETVLHVAVALTTSAVWAFAIVFVFGLYATVWGALSSTIRGRLVPTEVRGRVTSVYLLGGLGGIAVGSLAGGIVAQAFGVVAPMFVAGALNAILLAVFWRWLPVIGDAGRYRPGADDTP